MFYDAKVTKMLSLVNKIYLLAPWGLTIEINMKI